MAVNSITNPLLVFEMTGGPRSGKGTIVNHLATLAPTIDTEETGADYRVITLGLEQNGQIEPGMGKAAVDKAVGKLSLGQLTEMVAARKALTTEYGTDILYSEEVSSLVSSVSPHPLVRQAVKAGFIQRVVHVVQDESKHILGVDGRGLNDVIKKIPEAKLIMRTYVHCEPWEGARREVARDKTFRDATPDVIRSALQRQRLIIEKRMQDDAERNIDPVIPDVDAINYWWNTPTNRISQQRHADLYFNGDHAEAIMATLTPLGETPTYPRYGVGTQAVNTDKQILFDTTGYHMWFPGDPVRRMKRDAERMFTEGLATYIEQREFGRYEAELDEIIQR